MAKISVVFDINKHGGLHNEATKKKSNVLKNKAVSTYIFYKIRIALIASQI